MSRLFLSPHGASMKNWLKQKALELGFDSVGMASPSPQSWQRYQDWIAHEYHGEMGYLEKRLEERSNPASILPGVRSVIVVAKRYLTKSSSQNHKFKGAISCYAWGDDYHELMKKKLHELCDTIHEQTQGREKSRAVVDTAPLLERDFAMQSGIGWVGKHTNLLSQELGNWFFLGAILTTLEIEPDEPAKPHCGTCRKCLDVCPTHAFPKPYLLDARRCISYLTIELKGPIPRELRPWIGNRIFGCDDCLQVCPWNRFAQLSHEIAFTPRPVLETANLIDMMQWDEETFRKNFRHSPIKRAKRRGFLRNVAIALGNTRDHEAVAVLGNALYDHEPMVRGHAAWALGVLGGQEAQERLQKRMKCESDSYVREELRWALEHIKL